MGTMGACQCMCGGQTKTDTARFIVGHDAKHKSNLIQRVIAQADPEGKAYAELEERGWLAFLEKSRNSKVKKQVQRELAAQDGMPMSALRITEDMSEDEVAGLIRHREILVRREVRGRTFEERLEVGSVRLVAEGEIDFYLMIGWDTSNPAHPVPVTGGLRTIRVADIVGVYDA